MYLGMVLDQAEAEGYSVFSVRPLNPEAEAPIIPLCEADELASTLLDPHSHFSPAPHVASTSRPSTQSQSLDTAGLEDEDIELQRALQASLQDNGSANLFTAAIPTPTTRLRSEFAQSARIGFGDLTSSSGGGDSLRELHASASRSRVLLERARLDQQMAFREQSGSRSSSRPRTNRADEDEDEQLRRAMEESLKESKGAQMEDDDQEYLDLAAEENDDSDYYDAEEDSIYRRATPTHYPNTRSDSAAAEYIRSRPDASLPSFGQQSAAPITQTTNRVVDDEDAELQAALKASLEGLPEDFTESPNRNPSYSGPSSSRPPVQISREHVEEEEEEGNPAVASRPLEEKLSMDEMRRRRLARFGG